MSNKISFAWKKETDIEKLTNLAINAATALNWEEAAQINKKIVGISSQNVEALNRLARAQTCAGNLTAAQKTYKKVLIIDPFNLIAKKNLEKLGKIFKANGRNGKTNGNILSNEHRQTDLSFPKNLVFEPGKSKIISLLNLAAPNIIASLNCGEILFFNLKKHSICIMTEDGQYLGALPDDLAHRLLTYIAGGNKYSVFVKFSTAKNLAVCIREVERSAKFGNQPSFQVVTKN